MLFSTSLFKTKKLILLTRYKKLKLLTNGLGWMFHTYSVVAFGSRVAVFPDDVVVDRTGIERRSRLAGALDETRSRRHRPRAGESHVFLDEALRHRMHGHEADFTPRLPLDPEMHHALTALHVLTRNAPQLLAADAVMSRVARNGAIARMPLSMSTGGASSRLTRQGPASSVTP